jgi:hypothetical protein
MAAADADDPTGTISKIEDGYVSVPIGYLSPRPTLFAPAVTVGPRRPLSWRQSCVEDQ